MNRRCLITAALIVAALISRIPTDVQGQGEPSGKLDLPAMTLTPGDIEAFGLSGFGRIANGEFRDFDDYVARRAEFLNVAEATLRSSFEKAGWQRGYVTNLGLPGEPGNPESSSIQVAFSVVYEYGDDEGAAAAFAFNQNYDGVTDGNMEVLAPSLTYGDDSFGTHFVATEPADGDPINQIDITFRRGNVIATAGLIALRRGEDLTSLPPDAIATVEQMAERLLARVDATIAGETPGLSNQILHLGGDAPIAFSTEGYRRLNGDDPPYFNGYADDFPGVEGLFDEVTAAYELNQNVQLPGDPYFVVRLLEYSDAEGAAGYVASVRAAGISPPGTPAEDIAGAAQFGDSSWTIAYSAEFEPGVLVEGIAVFAHLGETALMLLLEGAVAPDLDVVQNLAAAQVDCLTAATCAPFEDLMGTPGATAVP